MICRRDTAAQGDRFCQCDDIDNLDGALRISILWMTVFQEKIIQVKDRLSFCSSFTQPILNTKNNLNKNKNKEQYSFLDWLVMAAFSTLDCFIYSIRTYSTWDYFFVFDVLWETQNCSKFAAAQIVNINVPMYKTVYTYNWLPYTRHRVSILYRYKEDHPWTSHNRIIYIDVPWLHISCDHYSYNLQFYNSAICNFIIYIYLYAKNKKKHETQNWKKIKHSQQGKCVPGTMCHVSCSTKIGNKRKFCW